jgi:hypothetical protein
MATTEQYAEWIVANQDKKGSPEFDTVAQAYRVSKAGASAATAPPKPLTNDSPNVIDSMLIRGLSAALPTLDKTYKAASGIPIIGGLVPERVPDIQGSWQGRIIQGAADPMIGAAQLGMNLVGQGDKINPVIQETNARTQSLRGSDAGFDFARLVGNVANPLPYKAAGVLPVAAGIGGRVAQGAGIGAAMGATAPVNQGDFVEQKAGQVAGGALVGGLLPVAWSALKSIGGSVKDVSDLITAGGAQRIFEKYQAKIIGADPAVRADIIEKLRNVETLVKGSNPTAAEALATTPQASPMVSYQNIIASTPGGPSGQFGQRMMDQEAARKAALQTVAKTPQELAAALKNRSDSASINYAQAFGEKIRSDPALLEMAKDPFFRKAIPDAMELAKSKGINPKENLTEFMHFVKIGMDAQLLPNSNKALTNTQQNAINDVRANLVDWLNKKNPAYDFARNEFAMQSQVIDRMNVGQTLSDKLVSATGKETPASFAQAVRNEVGTLKKATGQPRYEELKQLMTPEETATINSVLADVTRRSRAFNQPQGTNLYGGVNVTAETSPHLPNLLSRPAMLANALLRARGNKVEQEVDRIATDAYLNPSKLAALLEKMPVTQRNGLIEMILNSRNPAVTGVPIYALSQGNQ